MATRKTVKALAPLIAEFCAVSRTLWSTATQAKHVIDFARFTGWLESTGRPATVESLDVETLTSYVDHLLSRPAVTGVWRGDRAAVNAALAAPVHRRTLSRNTVNSYVKPLRTLCTYLLREGVITEDPFLRARRRGGANPLLPSEDTPTKGASATDIETLRAGATGSRPEDLRDRAIIEVLISTGARAGSLCRIRLEDVDLRRGTIVLTRAKGGRTYEVALQPEAVAAIARYLNRGRSRLLPTYPVQGLRDIRVGDDPGWLFIARDNGRRKTTDAGGRLTPNGLSQVISDRYRSGGGSIESFRAHRIRHGVATLLSDNGATLDQVAAFLGHTSTKATMRYARPTALTVAPAIGDAMSRAGLSAKRQRRAS